MCGGVTSAHRPSSLAFCIWDDILSWTDEVGLILNVDGARCSPPSTEEKGVQLKKIPFFNMQQ
jgi:hypothetical protein